MLREDAIRRANELSEVDGKPRYVVYDPTHPDIDHVGDGAYFVATSEDLNTYYAFSSVVYCSHD
jgi:hypothetical protein